MKLIERNNLKLSKNGGYKGNIILQCVFDCYVWLTTSNYLRKASCEWCTVVDVWLTLAEIQNTLVVKSGVAVWSTLRDQTIYFGVWRLAPTHMHIIHTIGFAHGVTFNSSCLGDFSSKKTKKTSRFWGMKHLQSQSVEGRGSAETLRLPGTLWGATKGGLCFFSAWNPNIVW